LEEELTVGLSAQLALSHDASGINLLVTYRVVAINVNCDEVGWPFIHVLLWKSPYLHDLD
jgi:hypothetical protein